MAETTAIRAPAVRSVKVKLAVTTAVAAAVSLKQVRLFATDTCPVDRPRLMLVRAVMDFLALVKFPVAQSIP